MRFAGKIISALPVLIIAVSTLAHAANEWIGRASVIDADTIEIHGTRIRIYGIDAIEARQRCQHNGQEWHCAKDSAFALDGYLKGKVVTCKKSGRDSWKRKVARCTVGGEDLGMWLVRSGWALDSSATRRANMLRQNARPQRRSVVSIRAPASGPACGGGSVVID